jgi:hypothetical protein
MTIVFPKNNLPEPAQPWAREVQKQLANVIASNRANEINNATRDNQLNSSLISLSKVVSDVKTASDEATEALNGLLGLGSSGSEYTLNASNITAGTITGITIQSASSGTRVVMLSSELQFYFGSSYVGKIQGNDNSWSSGAALTLISSTGGAQISLDGSEVSIFATSSGNGLSVTNSENISYGNFRVTNALFSNGRIDSGGNMRSGGTLGRVELDGGGTTGASINNAGNVIRTASSERYKQDIGELVINYEDLLLLSPKKFRLKEEVIGSEEIEANKNARYYAGFIAEEIAETPLDIFVSYEKLEDGTSRPDGVYYAELTAALLAGIKHQDTLIKSLTERITTLENGAN